MRILLDECVNHRLRDYLPGHDCQSARYAGFGGMKNGELLDAAQAANFEVLLTVDRGIAYQQDLNRRNIAIVILHAKSIQLSDLISLMPVCLNHLKLIQPGQIVSIGA